MKKIIFLSFLSILFLTTVANAASAVQVIVNNNTPKVFTLWFSDDNASPGQFAGGVTKFNLSSNDIFYTSTYAINTDYTKNMLKLFITPGNNSTNASYCAFRGGENSDFRCIMQYDVKNKVINITLQPKT